MAPKMFICDATDCAYNNGEGDCCRDHIGINDYGTCNTWLPKGEEKR